MLCRRFLCRNAAHAGLPAERRVLQGSEVSMCLGKGHGLAMLLALAGAVATEARADELQWSGFLTAGASGSNRSEPYGRGISKRVAISKETTLGLNLAKSLTPTVSAAAQFLARDDDADAAVKADWAFLTYHPVEPFSFTVGKQKLPMWMVSSYVDVGTAYPWVHPPEEVYSLFNLKSFTGASARGELSVAGSTLALEPFGGESIIEASPSAPTKDTKITGRNLFGADLEWTLDKTTARAAYSRAAWNLDLGDTLQFGERHYEIWSYGLMTRLRSFTLMGEYATTKDRDEGKYARIADETAEQAATAGAAGDAETAAKLGTQAAILHTKLGGARAYYTTAGYQLGDVGVFLTYASLRKEVLPHLTNDQTSVALGVNYDATPDSVIKLEGKRVHVPSGSTGLFQVAPGYDAAKLDGAMIYTANYNVVL
jgi:hypothetical protein